MNTQQLSPLVYSPILLASIRSSPASSHRDRARSSKRSNIREIKFEFMRFCMIECVR
jgi:hypothetical protein